VKHALIHEYFHEILDDRCVHFRDAHDRYNNGDYGDVVDATKEEDTSKFQKLAASLLEILQQFQPEN
jgi:hypothetical protein